MIGDDLEKYTFEYLMRQALEEVDSTQVDTREGSIIYDALAPACYRLASFYLDLKNVVLDTFVQTSADVYLDLKVKEFGMTRYEATHAVKLGTFEDSDGNGVQVPLGARFSTIGDNPLIYKVVKSGAEKGLYNLECETAGTDGNRYIGAILPLENYRNLATAKLTDLIYAARDKETDEQLKARFFEFVNNKPFGGNFSEYVKYVKEIDGVGAVQVYPVWNGGGTVKVCILDTEYNPANEKTIELVKNTLDPQELTSLGAGLVPIGHEVTVVAPEELKINLTFNVDLMAGYNIIQMYTPIKAVLQDYFDYLRKQWDKHSEVNQYFMKIYRSQVLAQLLTIPGIANVDGMRFNGRAEDLELQLNGNTQQLPTLGEVLPR